MRDDESEMVALPRPPGNGGADEVEAKKNEPEIEPGGAVDVSAGDAGAKA